MGNLSERKKFLAEMKEKKGKPLKVKKGKWAELREVTKAKKRAERKAMKEAGLLSSSEVCLTLFKKSYYYFLFQVNCFSSHFIDAGRGSRCERNKRKQKKN